MKEQYSLSNFKVFDTLTKSPQTLDLSFKVNTADVGIYACGITLYDHIHLGHLKSLMATEVLKNYLQLLGAKVDLVRNITDVDDKIIAKAVKEGVSPSQLVQKYIDLYQKEHAIFALKEDYKQPRASEYIPQIQSFITQLMSSAYAYKSDSDENRTSQDVYFNTKRLQVQNYWLSKKPVANNSQQEYRVQNKENKNQVEDFALWKSDSQYGWPSAWGQGRPGWHIECSAMHLHTLGEKFHIHMGGRDLITPHHDNEIAQSLAHNGQSPAQIWLHNGVIKMKTVVDGEARISKLSKSFGPSLKLIDLRQKYLPQALKHYVLLARPTSDQVYSEQDLQQSQEFVKKLGSWVASASQEIVDEVEKLNLLSSSQDNQLLRTLHDSPSGRAFLKAMHSNLNTPLVLSLLHSLTQHSPTKNTLMLAWVVSSTCAISVSGGLFKDFIKEMREIALIKEQKPQSDIIAELLEKRLIAREQKNWALSDDLRRQLQSLGYSVNDSKTKKLD